MRIQHNISAMNSYRNYNTNASALSKNLEKLSSGYKINRAGDDAAGLAISEKMRAQITGLDAAGKNVKDGISLVKTAEGALQEVQDMLNRMDYLATQSANGTYDNAVDRANLQKEVVALKSEINRIADSANFNGQKLLNGELDASANGTYDNAVDRANLQKEVVALKSEINRIADSANFNGQKLLNGELDAGVTVDLTAEVSSSKTGVVKPDGTIDTAKLASAGGDITFRGVTFTFKSTATATEAFAFKSVADLNNKLAKAFGTGTSIAGTKLQKTGKAMTLQIGDTADAYNQMKVGIGDMHTKALGIEDLDISKPETAQAAIATIRSAINSVSSNRGDLGAIQNRLEHTQKNLSVMKENIQDAESTIRDTDVADEMTAYTKNNILLQSAQAMLAQANQMPQGVLQLLQ